MSLLTVLKILHLWGLVMGLGGAVLADMVIFRHGILKPVRRNTVPACRQLSHIVFAGLAILWVTGAALVYMRTTQDPLFLMNQKLWAKVAIVVMLTVNGIAVHRFALPHVARRVGRRLFDAAPPLEAATLAMIATVSSVSWFMPFVLGVASELNFKVPALELLAIYGAAIGMGWALLFILASILPGFKRAAAKRPPIISAVEISRRLSYPDMTA